MRKNAPYDSQLPPVRCMSKLTTAVDREADRAGLSTAEFIRFTMSVAVGLLKPKLPATRKR